MEGQKKKSQCDQEFEQHSVVPPVSENCRSSTVFVFAYKKDRFGCLEIFPTEENSDRHGVETKEESLKIATKHCIVDAGEIPSIVKLQ